VGEHIGNINPNSNEYSAQYKYQADVPGVRQYGRELWSCCCQLN